MCSICAVTETLHLAGAAGRQVRDAFALAKEKAPAIIFIDEVDAIGTKRFDSELSGDREVQRTMLELLNQLDGFGSDESIKARSPYLPSPLPPSSKRSQPVSVWRVVISLNQ